MPGKTRRVRKGVEGRHKAAIVDLQCQLAQGDWTLIKSTELCTIHSIGRNFLTILVNHKIIECQVINKEWHYRRTPMLAHLTPQTFRSLSVAYAQKWYPHNQQTEAHQQLSFERNPIEPDSVPPIPFNRADFQPVPTVFKIATIGRKGTDHQVYDCDYATLDEAFALADSLMGPTEERAYVVEVKGVIERKTVVTRY